MKYPRTPADALDLQAVRDSGDSAPTVHVDVDTLTFDRLLIFLEAQALQRQLPGFAIHYLDDLQRVRCCCCLLFWLVFTQMLLVCVAVFYAVWSTHHQVCTGLLI